MNETTSDTKPQPKVTFEQALKVVQPKVEALMKEVLAGFELNPGDKKSHKRIFGALCFAGMETIIKSGATNLSPYSLSRRASRAASALAEQLAPKSPPSLTSIDGGADDSDDDSYDDGDDDSSADE